MNCPKCNLIMIKRRRGAIALLTCPPQYPMEWWCGCGYREFAGYEYEKTADEVTREEWEQINDEALGAIGDAQTG